MKFNNIIIAFITSVLLFTSCEEESFLGGDIEGIGGEPKPVGTLTASSESVDFTKAESIHFDLTFEESTSWLLTLEGLNSGAKTTFEGVTSVIDESNSKWDGINAIAPFFQVEDVVATVSFPNYPDVDALVDTFTISGIQGSKIEGVLISNFTTIPIYNFGNPEPAGGGWGSDFPVTVNTNTAFDRFDGSAYLYFEGAPWQANSPYIDILQIATNLSDTITTNYYPLYSDPDRVYVNLAVYNTGTEDTWFSVQFLEESTGETRTWDIRPNWIGWKNIAIKYSDLVSTGTSPYDPTTITLTNLVLLSDEDETVANRATVSIAIDQLEFSFDSPKGSVTY